VLRPQIFTCTRDSPRLASAHPKWGRGSPKNKFKREILKLALKFSLLQSITSGLVGLSSRNVFSQPAVRQGWWNGCKFWKARPKKFERAKIVQNFARFLTTFDFDRKYLQNGSTYQKSEKLLKIHNHSHVGWKKSVYFGPQTTKLFPLMNLHPNWLYSGDYISAPRGCCALKFLHVLEIHQGLLTHTPSVAGVPQKIIIVKIKNLA